MVRPTSWFSGYGRVRPSWSPVFTATRRAWSPPGFTLLIAIEIVAHRCQHVLPGYLKRKCRAFWSKETDAFVLDDPPRDMVDAPISGRKELSIRKGGIW